MAYICEDLGNSPETGEPVCLKWVAYVPHNIVPELSAADRDTLLLWMLGLFVTVFVVKMIRKLLGV